MLIESLNLGGIFLVCIAAYGLMWLMGLIRVMQLPDEKIHGSSGRLSWALIFIFIPYLAPIAFACWSLLQRRRWKAMAEDRTYTGELRSKLDSALYPPRA